ncbi:hypothetical protein FEAC_04080 [Ferrimicrobium acidiphilum DSM 19497]|uniref:Uncharacterized protein n=1 Tax=Ferrimicrobium acidiphilum DSM 19497 TaxID=1121877 RepID=A0A0D8FXG2_9ACTN|nr:hypothetical protein FEAC_04080 [Ferrimicrobium acidiphilum DSM 19497]
MIAEYGSVLAFRLGERDGIHLTGQGLCFCCGGSACLSYF